MLWGEVGQQCPAVLRRDVFSGEDQEQEQSSACHNRSPISNPETKNRAICIDLITGATRKHSGHFSATYIYSSDGWHR